MVPVGTISCDLISERVKAVIFNGLQKLTLLDYPGKVACTLFTAGCDFRCPFCHNATLVYRDDDLEKYSEDELLAFLKKRQGVLDGVAITGGEPLLNPDIGHFIEKVRELGYPVKLDTNGSYPSRLKELLDAGLVSKVAMDIKNSPEKYGITIGIPDYDITPINQSIELLMGGKTEYEFRTTVTGSYHTAEDFEAIGRWIAGAKEYYLQNFVDSGELIDPETTGATQENMHLYLETVRKFVPSAQLRGTE